MASRHFISELWDHATTPVTTLSRRLGSQDLAPHLLQVVHQR